MVRHEPASPKTAAWAFAGIALATLALAIAMGIEASQESSLVLWVISAVGLVVVLMAVRVSVRCVRAARGLD